MEDRPRTLRSEEYKRERMSMLNQPHIAPLTQYVEELRELGRGKIPYFDPMDGGVNAKILFVLQNPGPKAVASGFISRNNDDPTAHNTFELLQEAGIPREDTLLWNIVPWYDQTKKPEDRLKVTREETQEGAMELQRLISMLKHLKVMVSVGNKSRDAIKAATARRRLEIPDEICTDSS